jgi:hypothetical protein
MTVCPCEDISFGRVGVLWILSLLQGTAVSTSDEALMAVPHLENL